MAIKPFNQQVINVEVSSLGPASDEHEGTHLCCNLFSTIKPRVRVYT